MSDLTTEEWSAMITRDSREGRDNLRITRAEARCIYFAIWDARHGKGRNYTPEDEHRLFLVMAEVGRIGWPLS